MPFRKPKDAPLQSRPATVSAANAIKQPRFVPSSRFENPRWPARKHDFVFFGESYLCEECAKAGGFI
jgi:hypothetical protein